MSASRPSRIISASRRTDLPGFHADLCADRLARLRKPVHSVFFWTRHPRGLVQGRLGEMVRFAVENPLVHLTLTGLGGSALEPCAPTTQQALACLEPLLAALRGDPRRLIWRYDPVLQGYSRLDDFATLAREMGQLGVTRCVFSFPALLSLKGTLSPQYERHGIRLWSRADKRERVLRMVEIASRHGLQLYACNQPRVVQDSAGEVAAAACIDEQLAAELHPRGIELQLGKDPRQRRHCNCALSDDIGRYTDRCGSGCVYCYSKAGGPVGSGGADAC